MKDMKQLTRIKDISDDDIFSEGYFMCVRCDTYAYATEMRILFNLNKKGNLKIREDKDIENKDSSIICSACYNELSNNN